MRYPSLSLFHLRLLLLLLTHIDYTNHPSIRDFDIHGPAGPTAFWKLTDEVIEDEEPRADARHRVMLRLLGLEYEEEDTDSD